MGQVVENLGHGLAGDLVTIGNMMSKILSNSLLQLRFYMLVEYSQV